MAEKESQKAGGLIVSSQNIRKALWQVT